MRVLVVPMLACLLSCRLGEAQISAGNGLDKGAVSCGGAVTLAQASVGTTIALSATFTNQTRKEACVDLVLTVRAANSAIAFAQMWSSLCAAAGRSVTKTAAWSTGASAESGRYQVGVSAFLPGSTTLVASDPAAASFVLVAPDAGTPVPDGGAPDAGVPDAGTGAGADGGTSGWTNVVDDDFTQLTSIPSHWTAYPASWTSANHSPTVYYSQSHCFVTGGALHMLLKFEPNGIDGNSAATWYTCTLSLASGLESSPDVRVTLQWRLVSSSGGRAHHNMPLRWPNDNCWPLEGEEDWFEGESASFTAATPQAFMHYGTSCSGGGNSQIYHDYGTVDLTQWHTYRFQRKTTGTDVEVAAYLDDMNTPVWTCNSGTNPSCSTSTMAATLKHTVLQQEVPFNACPDEDDPRSPSGGCPVTGGDPSYYDGTSDFQVARIIVDNPG